MIKKLIFSTAICLLALASCQREKEVPQNKETTLSIIKPDAVSKDSIGKIIAKLESSGLKVSAIKMKTLTSREASEFYKVHEGKPFYRDLVEFMSSGPIVAIALEGDNAIAKNRTVMGATDPAKSAPGTIRREFAESVTKNAVHGSDSAESAKKELLFFFSPEELQERF